MWTFRLLLAECRSIEANARGRIWLLRSDLPETRTARRAIPPSIREQVMSQITEERLMTIADRSTTLGMPVDTLCGWRHRGEGPTGYRIGRHVRYRRSAVEAWLERNNRPAVALLTGIGAWPTSSAVTAGNPAIFRGVLAPVQHFGCPMMASLAFSTRP
jgi:predicted DNA-binding transcriptional regulator AlpA